MCGLIQLANWISIMDGHPNREGYASYCRWKTVLRCEQMKAAHVTATLKMALDAAGLDKAKVLHRPKAAVRQRLPILLGRPSEMAGAPQHGPPPRGSIP